MIISAILTGYKNYKERYEEQKHIFIASYKLENFAVSSTSQLEVNCYIWQWFLVSPQ